MRLVPGIIVKVIDGDSEQLRRIQIRQTLFVCSGMDLGRSLLPCFLLGSLAKVSTMRLTKTTGMSRMALDLPVSEDPPSSMMV